MKKMEIITKYLISYEMSILGIEDTEILSLLNNEGHGSGSAAEQIKAAFQLWRPDALYSRYFSQMNAGRLKVRSSVISLP